MMKKLFLFMALLASYAIHAQTPEELHQNAKTFMRQGDFSNAILVLNRAITRDENNIEISKDLAFCYTANGENKKALEIIKPLLNRDDADFQCYLIAGGIYKVLQDAKELEKLYKKGIKRFPGSGALYNELGEVYWAQKDFGAIGQWELGIQNDPSFAKNYYNACKHYYFSTDKVWSIIYGEIFININPLGSETAEIKEILLESYKKLFSDPEANGKIKNDFANAFIKTILKQSNVVNTGVSTQSLVMLRTRFILDWFNEYAGKFPFKLFDLQQQLLQEGLFDAYNQWIFGAAENLPAYQNWIGTNEQEYRDFSRFLDGRTFKAPTGQYYH
jgi:tetratricopeptide (TPR) repeat protein